MDKTYRESETSKLSEYRNFKASLKIIDGHGNATKWLTLTNEELQAIKKILTEGKS